MIFRRIQAFFNPEQYHGWGRKRKFFEGWYYKIVDQSGLNPFAIIPGIAMDSSGECHSFVQVLDGRNHSSEYHRFKEEAFHAKPGKLHLEIAGNTFSEKTMVLRLPELTGEIVFSGNVPWPKPWYSPGIMGPYSFVPFMECYHGIVSMDHQLTGAIRTKEGTLDFTDGRGYIEKDWGQSFPSAYIWMQSNHFSKPGTSFKASVAKIPWIGSSFTGFIAGLWLDNHLIKFTTYNRSQLVKLVITVENILLVLRNREYLLEISASRKEAAELASPIRGLMEGRIEESMAGEIHLKLMKNKTGELIFNDTGFIAGIEVAGDIKEIQVD